MSWRYKLNHSAGQHCEMGVPEMLPEVGEAMSCVFKLPIGFS
jgi:hypothetical protein